MSAGRDPLAGRIPVTLVTGFLGAGKTTLIARLVRHPDMNRVAVVINEIGEIGIDHDLVAMSSENVALLANGCICCTVRTDLQETLRELFNERRAGRIGDFDRVIVETTGMADPAPVVQTLVSDTLLGAQFRLDGVVTLVDAVNGPHLLGSQPEAEKQIALADRVLVTKTDLAAPDAVRALEAAVHAINRHADIRHVVQGEIAPAELVGLGLASARAGAATLRFLGEALDAGAGEGERYLGSRAPRHDPRIGTLSLRFAQPFTWDAFSAALQLLTTLRGPDMLRVKGIVNVDGRPVVVQGVQHIFHPPVTLDRWPSDDRATRLVFITRGIPAQAIRALFEAVGAVAAPG
ncbi:MAG: GTP-binding protein [Burkholderiales bacterium]|nr:GTP-binding protein [Burkholderiales bacterium]